MAIRLLCTAAALALTLSPALAETVTHAQGQTEITGTPETVLVYDIATLDNLDALGVPVAGAPGAALPPYLARYAAPIGTLFEPDFEAVNAAEPDLVLVGGRSAAQYAALSALVPTLDLTVAREGYIDNVAGSSTARPRPRRWSRACAPMSLRCMPRPPRRAACWSC